MNRSSKITRARTYQIDVAAIEAVGELAAALGVYPSSIVNMLLRRGLEEVEAGHWRLRAQAATYRAVWVKGGQMSSE